MCAPIVLVAALLLGIIGVGSHVNFVPVPVNVCGREMVSFVRIAMSSTQTLLVRPDTC